MSKSNEPPPANAQMNHGQKQICFPRISQFPREKLMMLTRHWIICYQMAQSRSLSVWSGPRQHWWLLGSTGSQSQPRSFLFSTSATVPVCRGKRGQGWLPQWLYYQLIISSWRSSPRPWVWHHLLISTRLVGLLFPQKPLPAGREEGFTWGGGAVNTDQPASRIATQIPSYTE